MADTSDEHPADPAKPAPVEVVILASAVPLPISAAETIPVIVADPRPDTFTGRPDPLGANPTLEQLKVERAELRSANAGRFKIEETRAQVPLPPPPPPPDRTFTVLVMLICLNTAKLCLILWILLTVLQVRDQYSASDATRATILTSLATLQRQLDQGVQQQQTLINRVDDTLVRLQGPPPR